MEPTGGDLRSAEEKPPLLDLANTLPHQRQVNAEPSRNAVVADLAHLER